MFVSDSSGNQDIYIENIDGTGRRNITHSPEREDSPVWSPDGKYILYDKESTAAENPQAQIWIAELGWKRSSIIDGRQLSLLVAGRKEYSIYKTKNRK